MSPNMRTTLSYNNHTNQKTIPQQYSENIHCP
jgi:hypothetical protein